MYYGTALNICKNTYFPVSTFDTAAVAKRPRTAEQTHTHEFTASTELALRGDLRHNHRFAGVTSEAIPSGRSHIHVIRVNTTFDLNHLHEVNVKTGPAQTVNPCDPPNMQIHFHYVEGNTTVNGAVPHKHAVEFITLSAPNPPV